MTTSRIRVESGGKREKEESLAGEFALAPVSGQKRGGPSMCKSKSRESFAE